MSHAGRPLVHTESEDVLLSNVFGVVKNLPAELVLAPWLRQVTGLAMADDNWAVGFWEKQPRPVNVSEGSTVVDLVLESAAALVFVEVKLDAPASSGTTHDPNRNQLLRNLDVGFRRAAAAGKEFAVVYLTADTAEPALVKHIRIGAGPFPINPEAVAGSIARCLHWASWASIGDAISTTYSCAKLSKSEGGFALDLLAYLAHKRLWESRLEDEAVLYADKLYRSLQRGDSPFVPLARRRPEPYLSWRDKSVGWRDKAWDEEGLRALLHSLRLEDKALLKALAEAGGAMRQDDLMQRIPMLRGKSSASLRALKAHVNGACKQCDRTPLLAEGTGSGGSRRHEINPLLGALRDVAIETARAFEIDWQATPTAPSPAP